MRYSTLKVSVPDGSTSAPPSVIPVSCGGADGDDDGDGDVASAVMLSQPVAHL
jgi:hypothetical protein